MQLCNQIITFVLFKNGNKCLTFLLYLNQFLEINRTNIFPTIFQKNLLFQKSGFADFFLRSKIIFESFLSHFILFCQKFEQN